MKLNNWRPDSGWAADIYYIRKEELLCVCIVKEEQT